MSVTKWIKQEKLRDLSVKELRDRIAELKASMFTSRFQRSSGKLENYRVLRESRRRLAAVMTIMREKEMAKKPSAGEAK
ncbi:50S ribosomal protein L29 [bacterium]|nr:50S ribosomal protein L29 [bacterium]